MVTFEDNTNTLIIENITSDMNEAKVFLIYQDSTSNCYSGGLVRIYLRAYQFNKHR